MRADVKLRSGLALDRECDLSSSLSSVRTRALPAIIRMTSETQESKRTICPKNGHESNNSQIYTLVTLDDDFLDDKIYPYNGFPGIIRVVVPGNDLDRIKICVDTFKRFNYIRLYFYKNHFIIYVVIFMNG